MLQQQPSRSTLTQPTCLMWLQLEDLLPCSLQTACTEHPYRSRLLGCRRTQAVLSNTLCVPLQPMARLLQLIMTGFTFRMVKLYLIHCY